MIKSLRGLGLAAAILCCLATPAFAASRTGTFTATGQSLEFTPTLNANPTASAEFNVSLWGTFVGTIALERSFDGGATWLPVTYSDGSGVGWTAAVSTVWAEPEVGVQYRVDCTAYTSGTINYRLSR